MAKFSNISKQRLSTCHEDLQTLFNEVIKYVDCTVVYGHRTVGEQQILYAQGRTMPGEIVTYLDGVKKKSKHNYSPSLAVDVIPYPIDWSNIKRFEEFGDFVIDLSKKMNEAGEISHKIEWGGHWNKFKDYPHYQVLI